MLLGMMATAEAKLMMSLLKVQMNWDFTIWQEMFGNGAAIGMAFTAHYHRPTPREQAAVIFVSIAVVAGTTMHRTVASLFATAIPRRTATAISGFAYF